MALDQTNRQLRINTPLGENVLLLTAFHGREEMSRPFQFQLEMISDKADIKPTEIVGKAVTFSVELADGTPRYFNGFVSRFSRGDESGEGRRNYFAEVVPWFWFLTRTSDCRIFQDKTALEIIEEVFQDNGFSSFDSSKVRGNLRKRTYCLQYRETDFNFVSRLLEEEGMFYFFQHENGDHKLIMADHVTAYQPCAEADVVYPSDEGSVPNEDHLTSWEHHHQFRSGKYAQTDYNFETPSTSLLTEVPTVLELADAKKYEFFDFPGFYSKTSEGEPLTRIRMEEEEVEYDVVRATSSCRSFLPGGTFRVTSHRSPNEENAKYVITSIHHSAIETMAYETGGAPARDYSNRLTCIPDTVIFRPARTTLKPSVLGMHSAVVVGPDGEEIYTDKYGRIKVQFHWDRRGNKDEHSSCWIRCGQIAAGKQWGAHFWPRIGHEVVVAFLEGDPDQPLVVGSVYHAENMPPYALPDNQTRSGYKSRSTPNGGPDDFNEIRFEDKKDKEEIYIHAEKDLNTVVENNETRDVGANRTTTIGDNDKLTIKRGDRDVTIKKGNDKLLIEEGNRETDILKGDDILFVQKGNVEQSVPSGVYRVTAKEMNFTGSDKIVLAVGGSTITIEPASIKLEIGGSSITLDPGSIKINAPMISSTAMAVNEIKGAPVAINC